MAQRRRIAAGFNLGGEQAEADPLLEEAFFASSVYEAIASRTDRHCFLIGRTGSGKSAVLQTLEEQCPSRVIRIDPENLSLPYILDLGVVQHLAAMNVHLDPLFIALWKHVFVVEVIRHRYNVDSPDSKGRVLANLFERIKRDNSKRAALEYLEEFGESFWCETDVRVREITTNFEKKVGLTTEGQVTLPGIGKAGAAAGASESSLAAVRTEEADRYQRLVNETQLARLNQMITVLNEDILDSAQYFTYIVIDDLDRDWVDEKLTNDLIRCLFRAALDLQRVRQLKIVVALRTNIFDHLNFGSRSGGQEEKFRALAFHVRWQPRELEELANERARVAVARAGLDEVKSVHDLLPPRTKQRGDPFQFLLDRTLMRPRDVITFLNECFRTGVGKNRLAWNDLYAAELAYSQNRLLALRDEWKPTFPGIDRVFSLFQSCKSVMNRDEFGERLDEAALLPAQEGFPGVLWMTQLSEPLWSGVGARDWPELYQPLVKLLFDIGFVGIRNRGQKIHYSNDSPGHADSYSHLTGSATFSIHAAFRRALDVE